MNVTPITTLNISLLTAQSQVIDTCIEVASKGEIFFFLFVIFLNLVTYMYVNAKGIETKIMYEDSQGQKIRVFHLMYLFNVVSIVFLTLIFFSMW